MKCTKCDRPVPEGKDRCLYCGASTNAPAASEALSQARSESGRVFQEDDKVYVRLDDLPEKLRQQVTQALQTAKSEVVIAENVSTDPKTDPATTTADGDRMLGALKTLEGIQQGFEADRIDYDEYREMVLQTLKKFLDGLEPKAALAFVLNELKSSALNPFIDDATYNALCRKILALSVPPVEKPKPWAFGILRKQRKK